MADRIRAQLGRAPGADARLPAEKVMARDYGVSLHTLRTALADLEREGLLSRRHGRGTYVRASSAKKPVAVLIDLDIGHPRTSHFFIRMVQSVRLQVEKLGHEVRLYIGQAEPGGVTDGITCRQFFRDLEKNAFAGVVALALPPSPEWCGALEAKGIPYVAMHGGFDRGVSFDFPAMARLGIRHLIARGRRRLAVLGPMWKSLSQSIQEEAGGAGISLRPEWMAAPDGSSAVPGLGWRLFRQIWSAREEKPDGLLILDDLLGQDAATAVLAAGIRVPGELHLVTEYTRGSNLHFPFPVDRLECDPDEAAGHLAGLISAMMDGRGPGGGPVVLPFRLVRAEEHENGTEEEPS